MKLAECRLCGGEPKRFGSGKPQEFCEACASRSCPVCESAKARGARSCIRCANNARKRLACECQWCGKEFMPTAADRTTCCSRECGLPFSGVMTAMRYAWRRAFKPFDQTTKTKPCAVCDRSFVGQASKYCSDGCRKEIARRKSRFYVLRKRSVSARECVVCGVEFTPEYQPWSGPRKMLVACSGACDAVRVRRSKRDMKAKRRARKRTATVETVRRAKIFERDGWRCRLCGKVVARNKVVPHPRAPVLDHIIPLARGGTHEGRNVHTAHFICNSLKGDRAVGEQLLLVG